MLAVPDVRAQLSNEAYGQYGNMPVKELSYQLSPLETVLQRLYN